MTRQPTMKLKRNTSTTTSTATPAPSSSNRKMDPLRMEQEQLKKVLEESESQYKQSQQLLERREAEQLQHATLESKTLQEIHAARLSLLEQAERETLDLVLQHSQQLNPLIDPQQIQERERIELELALALSLNQSKDNNNNNNNNNNSNQNPDPDPSEDDDDDESSSADPFDQDTEDSDDNPFKDPVAVQEELVDHIEILCQNLSTRIASSPPTTPQRTSSFSLPPPPAPSPLSPPSRPLPPSVSSLASSLPPPPSTPSSALLLPSPHSAVSSTSTSNLDYFPPRSRTHSSNYLPSASRLSPSPPLLGKPLPPVPDRSKKPSVRQTLNHEQGRSTSPRLSVSTQHLGPSNFGVIPTSSTAGPPSTSSPIAYEIREEPPSYELISSPQLVSSPYTISSLEFPLSHRNQTSAPTQSATYTFIPAEESFTPITNDRREEDRSSQDPTMIDVTITACSSSQPSRPMSPSLPSRGQSSTSLFTTNSMASDPFGANPAPPENVTEGIQFGSIKTIHDQLDSDGQFPNVVELTQFLRGSTSKIQNPLFAIQAWSWNRLLTYLMWHGNSQIEPGPLDITEAEDEGLGTWLAGMSVIFNEGEGEASVRLVLELVAGNGDSQWNRSEPTSGRRHSSVVIGSTSNNGKREDGTIRYHYPEVIHLPKPYMKLPIQLSTLACNLHEIHSVCRMSSSMSTGITCSFKSNKHKNHNTVIYTKLSKAIESNAKLLDEPEPLTSSSSHHFPLVKKGKNWWKKTKPSSRRLSLHSPSLPLDRNKASKTTNVDGLGLPLPDGATMVRPWDCDWS